jgi:SOS-response transcriptional repressor LexA
LATKEGKAPEGLADKLTVAVSRLEAGLPAVFPSLGELRLTSALPEVASEDQESYLGKLEHGVRSFIAKTTRRIQERWAWWERENAPGSKVGLLLRASEFYDPEVATCPVCEQSVASLPVAEQLASLKRADPELAKELRTFFGDLQAELLGLVPEDFKDLGTKSPRRRLEGDWRSLKDAVLGGPLGLLAAETGEWIEESAESLSGALPECPPLMPEGADEAFKTVGKAFLSDVTSVLGSLANLRWSLDSMDSVESELKRHMTDDAPGADSLLARLAKGKDAAAHVKPLTALRESLRRILKTRKTISNLDTTLADLEELRGALDELKPLSKYAVAEVSGVFESIRGEALKHWGRMYPESSTGMKPGRLVLKSGRDKSVEALLSRDVYEVPGQYFANAGLQRAIALAFFFALLDRHPKGLDFILLDDPILSLDDDHRERWSYEVLRPRLDEFQVILATHQRQYFQHCGHHFRKERIYELNPRDHAQRVSVKPGHELARAEAALRGDWRTAPNIMRQYRDRLFLTLDAYSPALFFDSSKFVRSFAAYKAFSPPHILAGPRQRRIVGIFENPKVDKVLDPGSHGLTEVALTKPMVEDCLLELRKCDEILRGELKRLDALRDRSRRTIAVPATLVAFPELPEGANWDPFAVPVIGRAAARSDPWVVDVAEDTFHAAMNAGSLVLVTGESLDPVAKAGQWVMLATDDVTPADGDLVAVADEEGNRLLRRLWSAGDTWVLQPTNPVKPVACRLSPMASSAMRKVVGVVYLGATCLPPAPSGALCEWAPIEAAPTGKLNSLRVIAVEGSSLDPIARKGQWVLVRDRVANLREVEQGALAAVVTDDERIGNVLKRVYVQGEEVTLVSPNPVDLTPPAVIPLASVREVWPFAGVLFEGLVASSRG